jgi:UPF0042 nucleotide-binding protein
MAEPRRFILVTGVSGAGKTLALHFLEDLGFFCVDNLPAPLIPPFASLVASGDKARQRVALCIDARSGSDLERVPAFLDELSEQGIRPDVLFLESSTPVILQRYSESRRRHPLGDQRNLEECITDERRLLEPVRARADLILDTSVMSVGELRERLAAAFLGRRMGQDMLITIMSFGFKYGVPPEADLMLDVRFLPNPHYDKDLRPWTGNEPDVRSFVLENPVAKEFLDHGRRFLKFLLPHYEREPKSYLTIAIGCTGGRHRSVAVAHDLAIFLRGLGRNVRLRHRDVERDT